MNVERNCNIVYRHTVCSGQTCFLTSLKYCRQLYYVQYYLTFICELSQKYGIYENGVILMYYWLARCDPYCQSTCLCVTSFDAEYLGN